MVESNHMPTATNKLPDLKTEFADPAEKGAHVNEIVNIAAKAVSDGDKNWQQFTYKEAHVEYIVALDGFMHLMKLTKDDANF